MYKVEQHNDSYIIQKLNTDSSWSITGQIRSVRKRGTTFWHAVSSIRHTGSLWDRDVDAVAWLLWCDGLDSDESDREAASLLSML